jgi:hypothetical protein
MDQTRCAPVGTPREFRFRLNDVIIPEICIQRALISGEPVGELQIAVRDPTLGWFIIDDNSTLWSQALPRFVLEYRDETAWRKIDPLLRQISRSKGWIQVAPKTLIVLLQFAGLIN